MNLPAAAVGFYDLMFQHCDAYLTGPTAGVTGGMFVI